MNIAHLSIKRPIFICSIVLLMLLTGWVAMGRMGVDLFPDVNIPVVSVATIYPGAGPEEIEELISKPLEEELSSISGLKKNFFQKPRRCFCRIWRVHSRYGHQICGTTIPR